MLSNLQFDSVIFFGFTGPVLQLFYNELNQLTFRKRKEVNYFIDSPQKFVSLKMPF
jgi:hypothetical protein